MEKDKKIIKHLRESRETLTTCCSKLIKAEAGCKQFLLAIDSHVVKEKNTEELEAEMNKMQSVLNELVQKVKDFENTWLKGTQKYSGSVVSRADRGRRDNVDSGILSADSKYMQPSPESSDDEIKNSSIITHPSKDCKEKDESSSNAISLLQSTNEDDSSGASEHEDKDPMFHIEDQDQAGLPNEKGEDAQSQEQLVEGAQRHQVSLE